MQNTLDIVPFLCESFSTNSKIYKLIDELYKKDKVLFYQTARESKWYSHPIATEGSLEQEEYFKKFLGIFINHEKYNDEIISIIKKGWNYAYTYILNHETINLEDFLISYTKKMHGVENILQDDVNANVNILISIAANKINTSSKLYIEYFQILLERLNNYEISNPARISLSKATKEELKKINEIRNKIINTYGNMKNIDNLRLEETNLKNYSTASNFIFDYEDLSLVSIVNDIRFTDKDINEIIYTWVYMFDDNNDITEIGKFIYDKVRIKYFCKAYKAAKEYHFKNNQESMYLELQLYEDKLKKINIENTLLAEKCDSLELKIQQLEKENARLNDELNKNAENKNELIALRDFMFKQDHKLSEDLLYEEVDINRINQIKGLILGGSDKIQQKLKEKLSNFKFISVEALNFDKRLLNDVDIIFIYTSYLNHGIYYKLMSLKKEQKIVYLSPSINLNLILNQIYENIKTL